MVPDHSFLAVGYSRHILAWLLLRFSSDDHFKAMMLGVGGGALSSYLMHNFRNCHLTGRRKVANQTPFRRLLFVALHPAHEYGTKEQLQEELNAAVMNCAPPRTMATDDVYFVVMQSILYPDERISVRYDLKACEARRYTKDESESEQTITVLKDMNFGARKLHLGAQGSWFHLQIQHDTEFLRNLRVIDYSLLVGVQPLHLEEIKENQELASIVRRTQKSTSCGTVCYDAA